MLRADTGLEITGAAREVDPLGLEGTRTGSVVVHHTADDEPVVVLAGALDLASIGRLRRHVMDTIALARDRVRVDASRVTAVSSVGLRTLIACRRLAGAAGLDLVIERPSPVVARLLRQGRLERVFTIEPADLPADGACRAPRRKAASAG